MIRIAAADLRNLKLQFAQAGLEPPGLGSVAMAGAAFATLVGFSPDMPADFRLHSCLEQYLQQTFTSVAVGENFLH